MSAEHSHGHIPPIESVSAAPVERIVPDDTESIDLDKARAALDAERIHRQQAAAKEIAAVCEKYGVRLDVQANITLLDTK
jgi:hypothetical protein